MGPACQTPTDRAAERGPSFAGVAPTNSVVAANLKGQSLDTCEPTKQ